MQTARDKTLTEVAGQQTAINEMANNLANLDAELDQARKDETALKQELDQVAARTEAAGYPTCMTRSSEK